MNIVILGATGDVGGAVVREAGQRGWTITAVTRSARNPELSSGVEHVRADVSTQDGFEFLLDSIDPPKVDAVVVALNERAPARPVADWNPQDLGRHVANSVTAHHRIAQGLVPVLPPNATLLGIGGGMADATVPGYVHAALEQSALRMLYRALHKENPSGPRVQELIIQAMVRGDSNRAADQPGLLNDDVIASAICNLLAGSVEQELRSQAVVVLTGRGDLRVLGQR